MPIWDKKYNEDGILISKKLIIPNIALNFLDHYKIITVGDVKFDMYCHNKEEGIYRVGAEKKINEYVEEKTEGEVTKYQISEIIGHIQRKTYADRKILINEDLDLICVGNGILNTKTLQLKPFDSKQIFTQRIEWNYVPKADCPNIKKFINEILSGDEDINTIQEFIGYILHRLYFIKKSMLLVGKPDTAKTTLINLIVKFIGEENTSGESLHKILNDKFSSINLYRKLLNFHDDLSFKDIRITGEFKIATGSGYLSGEKKFGESFKFMNYAKLLFATNKISTVEDTEDMAYYGRWLIIFCENVFNKENSKTDKNIFSKLITREELSGLLNWALEGLDRLLKNQNFSYSKTAEENRVIMEKNSSSISAFVNEEIKKEDNNWVATEDLYNAYCEYCAKNLMAKESMDKFSKTFGKRVIWAIPKQRDAIKDKKLHKKVRGWLHVLLFMSKGNTSNTFIIPMSTKNIKGIDVFNKYNIEKGVTRVTQEETIEQKQKYDPRLDVWVKCSVKDCDNCPCNFGSKGFPYCEDHFKG